MTSRYKLLMAGESADGTRVAVSLDRRKNEVSAFSPDQRGLRVSGAPAVGRMLEAQIQPGQLSPAEGVQNDPVARGAIADVLAHTSRPRAMMGDQFVEQHLSADLADRQRAVSAERQAVPASPENATHVVSFSRGDRQVDVSASPAGHVWVGAAGQEPTLQGRVPRNWAADELTGVSAMNRNISEHLGSDMRGARVDRVGSLADRDVVGALALQPDLQRALNAAAPEQAGAIDQARQRAVDGLLDQPPMPRRGAVDALARASGAEAFELTRGAGADPQTQGPTRLSVRKGHFSGQREPEGIVGAVHHAAASGDAGPLEQTLLQGRDYKSSSAQASESRAHANRISFGSMLHDPNARFDVIERVEDWQSHAGDLLHRSASVTSMNEGVTVEWQRDREGRLHTDRQAPSLRVEINDSDFSGEDVAQSADWHAYGMRTARHDLARMADVDGSDLKETWRDGLGRLHRENGPAERHVTNVRDDTPSGPRQETKEAWYRHGKVLPQQPAQAQARRAGGVEHDL